MIVEIEGLIGVGKSTVCQKLQATNKYKCFFEPVSENPCLELYYKDPNKYAFLMQTYIMMERFKQLQAAQNASLMGEKVVLDRSFYGDFAFALVQYELGYFDTLTFEVYKNMFNLHLQYLMLPDLIIFLDCDIDTTIDRIKDRSRDCECNIEKSYLESLRRAYRTVLETLKKHTKVVHINTTLLDKDKVFSQVKKAIEGNANRASNLKFDYNIPPTELIK